MKIEVANESEMMIAPLVLFGSDFISRKPIWSRQPARRSMAWPLAEQRLARDSKYCRGGSARMDRERKMTILDCTLVVFGGVLVDVVV